MTIRSLHATSAVSAPSRPRRVIGPRLRVLLYAVFAITAVTAANSVYLASITALEWLSRRGGTAVSYQDHFYLSMFALHVALGLLLIVPFLVFGIAHLWRHAAAGIAGRFGSAMACSESACCCWPAVCCWCGWRA